jgi:ATP-dependent exoDNAse (exonuclease V) beta subunit
MAKRKGEHETEEAKRLQIETLEAFEKPRELLKLARINKHKRDARVVLLDGRLHRYIIDNEMDVWHKSMTWLKEQFFPKFNKDEAINNSHKWRLFILKKMRSQYVPKKLDAYILQQIELYFKDLPFDACPLAMYPFLEWASNAWNAAAEEIKTAWSKNGAQASQRGVYIHRQIELYLNEEPCDMEAPEMLLFLKWYSRAEKQGMMPLRTEMSVFVKKLFMAGQLDALFIDANGDYVIVDWKVSLIKSDPFCWCFKKRNDGSHEPGCSAFGSHPLTAHLPACDQTKYFIQLNLYRFVLKQLYNVDAKRLLLVALHSTLSEALEIEAPIWEELVEGMLRWRADELGLPFDLSD